MITRMLGARAACSMRAKSSGAWSAWQIFTTSTRSDRSPKAIRNASITAKGFFRAKDDRLVMGFSTAQIIAITILTIGIAIVATRTKRSGPLARA